MGSKKKVLLIFDLAEPLDPEAKLNQMVKGPDWESEVSVINALKKLGHEVTLHGVYDNIPEMIAKVDETKPDVVYNMIESFKNERDLESNLPAIFELLGQKYTGANSHSLQLCKDKSLTKKILMYHDVRVPTFIVSSKARPIRSLKEFRYPAICKPLGLEASEGITQTSFVHNEKDCLERIRFLHEKLGTDVIVEEYIDGREIYVGVLGNQRLTVLPPRELFFEQMDEGDPKFATYKSKWDKKYRKRWGIRNGPAKPISPEVWNKIQDISKQVYRLFRLSGYARIDFRLKDGEEPVFLEVNPNPSISYYDDFAQSAKSHGIEYPELIERIVNLANC